MEILTRLLDAYERSSSYGGSPWRRDILLKLDSVAFPDAFAPNGRERYTELMRAALDLERKGAVRIRRHPRGPLSGEPKEIGLGPAELNRAYTSGADFGYEQLYHGIGRIERHARILASRSGSDEARTFLENFASTLTVGDLAAIGMGRPKFKQEWRALIPALTASVALLRGYGSRMGASNQREALSRFQTAGTNAASRDQPACSGWIQDGTAFRWRTASDLLEAYGVRRKPGLIQCAGSGAILVAGREYRLDDFTPVAHIPDAWSEAWVEALRIPVSAWSPQSKTSIPSCRTSRKPADRAALAPAGKWQSIPRDFRHPRWSRPSGN